MNIEQLQLLNWLIRDPHLSRAAIRLGKSQSAVSKQLAKIEEELEIKLFERNGVSGLTPTRAAKQLGETADFLVSRWDEAIHLVKNPEEQLREFKITGPSLFLKNVFLPFWVKNNWVKHYKLRMYQSRVLSLAHLAVEEDMDAVVLFQRTELPDFRQKKIYEEELVWVTHADYSGSLDPIEVLQNPTSLYWVGYRSSSNPLQLAFQLLGVSEPPIHAYVEDVLGMIELIRLDPRFTSILPRHAIHPKEKGVRMISIPGLKKTPIYLLYRNDATRNSLYRSMKDPLYLSNT